MSRWFRYYEDALTDPKVQCLDGNLFKTWVNLLCVASKMGGKLPVIHELSYLLSIRSDKLNRHVNDLSNRGLLDLVDDHFEPHNWRKRQYKSDNSTERVKRFRNAQGNVSSAVSVTPPENRIQNTEKKEDTSLRSDVCGVSKKYAFESGVIRLNEKDLKNWEDSFSHLDLRAELISLSAWAETQTKWFHAVAGALAKRNREQKNKVEQARAGPVRRHTRDDPMAGII